MVGFGNIPESALNAPPLTTVHQPTKEMGRRAAALLLSLLRGEAAPTAHLTLATHLVVRASTLPPAGRTG
ncbi:substrate-binding domain-containing protein [Pseudofrankia sp. DC12]|uniref:substrate-binding domain-containing protein n=1 Tax=Pseudofrankia sp. DC12 TaxID=683315 RepID=UPI0005F7B7D8|nr:substrate-binding domain-containing protein [Pseudofrankia sp. DC12]